MYRILQNSPDAAVAVVQARVAQFNVGGSDVKHVKPVGVAPADLRDDIDEVVASKIESDLIRVELLFDVEAKLAGLN